MIHVTQALLILVGDDGSVENRVIDLPRGMGASALVEAGNFMSARLGGMTLAEAQAAIGREIAASRATLDSTAEA